MRQQSTVKLYLKDILAAIFISGLVGTLMLACGTVACFLSGQCP